MFTLIQLQEQRAKAVADARAIHDAAEGNLTEEQTAEFDGLMAKADDLKNQIDRLKNLETVEGGLAKPQPRITMPGQPGSEPSNIIYPSMYRSKKLIGFRDDESAYKSGMWIRAQIFGDETAAGWCRDNLPANVMTTGVGTKGGFLVPEEFEQSVIDLRESYGVFRQNARVFPMGSDTANRPRREGGLTAYAVGETDEITASDKSWGNVNLTAHKWGVMSRISSDLEEDAVIDLAMDLASEMAYAFAEKEDDAGFNGDGTSTYHGVQGIRPKIIDGTHTAGAVDVSTATHNLFSEIDATDLANLMGALPQYALGGAKWYCSQYAWAMVFERLMAAAGGNTIANLTAGVQKSYLGYPVVISQKMPAGPTTDYDGLAMLLFGDLSRSSTLGNRRGFRMKTSEGRYIEFDQTAVQGTTRFDINNHDLGDNTNAGPVVALIGSSS